ncbi:hypothetical protein D3C87_1284010 [compost metagenome]
MGFADDPLAQYRDLVGTDDQMSGVAIGQCAGLGLGEALDQLDGGLLQAMALVDIRRAAGKRQLQAGQQLSAINRA